MVLTLSGPDPLWGPIVQLQTIITEPEPELQKASLNNIEINRCYLPADGRPDFERVVVGAADDQVSAELQTRDHMVVMTF